MFGRPVLIDATTVMFNHLFLFVCRSFFVFLFLNSSVWHCGWTDKSLHAASRRQKKRKKLLGVSQPVHCCGVIRRSTLLMTFCCKGFVAGSVCSPPVGFLGISSFAALLLCVVLERGRAQFRLCVPSSGGNGSGRCGLCFFELSVPRIPYLRCSRPDRLRSASFHSNCCLCQGVDRHRHQSRYLFSRLPP